MKKLLLFVLLLTNTVFAQPDLMQLSDMYICSDNNSPAIFNLTFQENVLLAPSNPDLYTIKYYTSLQDAQNSINSIAQPQAYTVTANFEQTIYVTATEIANPGNHLVGYFDIVASAIAIAPLHNIELCSGFTNPDSSYYTLDTGLSAQSHYFTWQHNGITIPGTTQSSYTPSLPGEYTVFVQNTSGCSAMASSTVTMSGLQAGNISIQNNDSTITILVDTTGDFRYSINDGQLQESNIFTNVEPGVYFIKVVDGCNNIFIINYAVPDGTPAPTGQAEQTFGPGATLADMEVTGQNIQWYNNPGNNSNEINPLNNDEPLPLSTVLVNGTTYYASQTINGIESQDRLAVTVNVLLQTDNYSLKSLKYYPNPATGYVIFSNNTAINSLEFYNSLGQKVLENESNSTDIKTDISHLPAGIYMVKIKSGNTEKTVRVIRQ